MPDYYEQIPDRQASTVSRKGERVAKLRQQSGPRDESVVITAEGDLDHRDSRDFDQFLAVAEEDRSRLILDLSAVSFIDSSALAVIVRHWKKLSATGGALVLVGARKRNTKVFWISGLSARLSFYETVTEAAADLTAGS